MKDFEPQDRSPFFAMLRGDKVPWSVLKAETPFAEPAVERLVEDGEVVGQHTFTSDPWGVVKTDIIFYKPKLQPKETE